MTYGAIVRQLLTDYEDVEEVNKQLDTMGYNIGVRLIDEFLAKANITRCNDFRESVDILAKVGLKMFLGISPSLSLWSPDSREVSLLLDDHPLADFVELPRTCEGLVYGQMLCGAIRGAMEQVNLRVEVRFVRDMLRGDDAYEIRLKLLEQTQEVYPYKDDS